MSPGGSAVPATYVVRAGSAQRDRDAVIAVWRGNLGREDRLAAKYDWFYLGCPFGYPLLQVMRHEPTAATVGVAAAGPRRMVAAGVELGAGVLVDMAVRTVEGGAEPRRSHAAVAAERPPASAQR